MSSPEDYQRFKSFALELANSLEPKDVDGDYYDLPGTIVYRTSSLPLADKGRLEVNVVTPEAAQAFEWEIEITINDKSTGRFIHLILRPDGSAVETYGKNVIEIDSARADEIMTVLEELSA